MDIRWWLHPGPNETPRMSPQARHPFVSVRIAVDNFIQAMKSVGVAARDASKKIGDNDGSQTATKLTSSRKRPSDAHPPLERLS